MKAIVLAIVSLSACAALANSPAAPAKPTTTTTTTTTAPAADAHAGHDAVKHDDKCAGKTGKDLDTCKATEAKKLKK
ncbi:MAG: hypothetical protein KF767_06480 [Bdellovibrionaceae bacterium]|nr:hypothetical protein [Pseudobdellovibrionaceae bacterium]